MAKKKFTIHSLQKNLSPTVQYTIKDTSIKEKTSSERISASPTMIYHDLDRAPALARIKDLKFHGINAEILASPSNITGSEDGEIVHFDFSTGEAYDPNKKIVGKITGCELTEGAILAKRLSTITRFGRRLDALNKKALSFGPSQSNVQFFIPKKYSQTNVLVAELRFLISRFSENRINLLEGQAPGFSISIRKYQNKYYLHFSIATDEGWKSFTHYSTPITLLNWHEAAFIFNAGTLSVILDSHLISHGIVPAKRLKSVGNRGVYLGTWIDGKRNQFNGKIQYMKLWSKVPDHILNSLRTNQNLDDKQICGYKLSIKAPIRIGSFLLPGQSRVTQFRYRSFDGLVVLDGGIILGKESDLTAEVNAAANTTSPDNDSPYDGIQTRRQALLAVSGSNKLWDNGILYYQTQGLSTLLKNRLDEAIEVLENETNIRFVAASGSDKDVVVIRINRDAGDHNVSYSTGLGRVGGKQHIALYQRASVSTIIHEILHALGIMHEQCRNDRDSFIELHWNNMDFGRNNEDEQHVRFQFQKYLDARDMGSYDYRSIMHYHSTAFGKTDPDTGNQLETITSRTGTPISRLRGYPFLSPVDIAQMNTLYPIRTSFDDGHTWGAGAYTTGIAFGDINGDGADELLVARKHNSGNRFFFYANELGSNPYSRLASGGSNWGSGAFATCIAAGDVDGDGIDEVIIGRKSPENMRFEIRKYDRSNAERSVRLFEGGNSWGDSSYTTGVAISKDRRGRVLIAVCRRTGSNARFYIFGGASQNYRLLYEGGRDWGSSYYATGIAFGDVDGDGNLEVGVTRYARSGARFLIYKAINGDYTNYQILHSGGSNWGSSYYATAIAFGDVDGDGKQEVGVTRKASENARFFIYGNASQNFRQRHTGGNSWGDSYYANSIAMADVDNDGRAEILVGRYANSNSRYFLYDDSLNEYQRLADGGKNWGKGRYTTSVALGNPRGGMNKPFIGIGRKAGSNSRLYVHNFNP